MATRVFGFNSRQCQIHQQLFCAESALETSQLYSQILHILESKESDQELQGNLVDLLGFANMELMSLIVSNRKQILDSSVQTHITKNNSARIPYGAQVSIQSVADIKNQKLSRKELKRSLKKEPVEYATLDGNALRDIRADSLLRNSQASLALNRVQLTNLESCNSFSSIS
jgi:hypothetical protein